MAILITGGAGYIGSHTMVEFLNAGRELVVVDNLMNSNPEVLERVRKITGKDFKFFQVDLLYKEVVFTSQDLRLLANPAQSLCFTITTTLQVLSIFARFFPSTALRGSYSAPRQPFTVTPQAYR